MDGVEGGAITKSSAGDQDREIDPKTILVKGGNATEFVTSR